MDASTTISVVNGNCSVKPPHKFSGSPLTTDNTSFSQQRVHSYMATRNGGGDPVTALGVRGVAADSSVSGRHAELLRNFTDGLIKYNRGSNSEYLGPVERPDRTS
ncbi:hypothetical protein F4859DRAFT_488015 [Xylaria cf. heliscus]|nr:hypothetical protein F4859DRAFT_488015 [Xylaria cf. heliscus]